MDQLNYSISQAVAPYMEMFQKAREQLSDVDKFGALMDKYMPEFAKMVSDAVDHINDGWQFSDLSFLSQVIGRVIEIASEVTTASGEEKKQFAVDTVWLVYHSIDTGPDGKQNRIKVPGVNWLTAIGIPATEEKIERYILGIATKLAIDTVYPAIKEKLTKSE